MNWPSWTREPLVHFLVIGAVIFALFAWRGNEVDPSSRLIDVDRDLQGQIALRFERTSGRAPTDAELDQQIAQYIRDEVLYREALRLGLDQGDPVVRRRLVTKMDLAASAQAEVATPSDDTLRAWFVTNEEHFIEPPIFGFDQLYFERARDAIAALKELNSGSEWREIGEPISLPPSLDRAPPREIEAVFGAQFAAQLNELDAGDDWLGPIASGFGHHIIRIRSKEKSKAPDFDTIRQDIENQWRTATIADRKQKAFELLRDAYRIEVAE